MPTNYGDEIIESEDDVTAGTWIMGNDAYDLALVREVSGNYVLQLSMKLQFFFEDAGDDKWDRVQKEQFVRDWESIVRNVWDNVAVGIIEQESIHIKLKLETQIEGWMADHWEIHVTKKPSYPANSSVPGYKPDTKSWAGNVYLAFDNVQLRAKNACPAQIKNQYKQVLATHEFGHMLGITLDEYKGSLCEPNEGGNVHNDDYASIMHIGQQIRDRHRLHMVTWLSEALKKHGIK